MAYPLIQKVLNLKTYINTNGDEYLNIRSLEKSEYSTLIFDIRSTISSLGDTTTLCSSEKCSAAPLSKDKN